MTAVTVVLPTFARRDYLRRAIASVLAQRHDDFVVAIGDNEGSAATRDLVASFGDRRLEYYGREKNLGAQGNWLALVRDARTPLVATLHDDDQWKPDFLARLVPPMLADPALGMTFSDFEFIDADGRVCEDATRLLSASTHRDRLPEGPIRYDRVVGLRLVAVWNAPNPSIASVLRREHLLSMEFPSDAAPLYDLWAAYQFVKAGAHLHYVRGRYVQYRTHTGSLTTVAGYPDAEDWIFQRIVNENADAGPVLDEIRRYWAGIRWGRALGHMADPSRSDASRREMAAAAPHLPGIRRYAALAASRCGAAWSAMRWLRARRAAVRA